MGRTLARPAGHTYSPRPATRSEAHDEAISTVARYLPPPAATVGPRPPVQGRGSLSRAAPLLADLEPTARVRSKGFVQDGPALADQAGAPAVQPAPAGPQIKAPEVAQPVVPDYVLAHDAIEEPVPAIGIQIAPAELATDPRPAAADMMLPAEFYGALPQAVAVLADELADPTYGGEARARLREFFQNAPDPGVRCHIIGSMIQQAARIPAGDSHRSQLDLLLAELVQSEPDAHGWLAEPERRRLAELVAIAEAPRQAEALVQYAYERLSPAGQQRFAAIAAIAEPGTRQQALWEFASQAAGYRGGSAEPPAGGSPPGAGVGGAPGPLSLPDNSPAGQVLLALKRRDDAAARALFSQGDPAALARAVVERNPQVRNSLQGMLARLGPVGRQARAGLEGGGGGGGAAPVQAGPGATDRAGSEAAPASLVLTRGIADIIERPYAPSAGMGHAGVVPAAVVSLLILVEQTQ